MSIATQIERLQNIKTNIRAALVSKGVSAESHNMADFAEDIENISAGVDVSDTTATASDVVSGKDFYNADGVKTAGSIPFRPYKGLVKLDPFGTNRLDEYSPGFYPNAHGAYVDEIVVNDVAPSDVGTPLEAWKMYRTIGDGYFYDHKPEIHIGEVYTKGTNTVEFPEGYDSVLFVYGAQNSGTITFSDCDFEEVIVVGGQYQGFLKIYKLTKTTSPSFTVTISIGGAYNCHWTILY